MERQGDEVHIETDEARGASTPNIVRWILLVSLFAAIALLSIIWITGAATQSDSESSIERAPKRRHKPSIRSMAADCRHSGLRRISALVRRTTPRVFPWPGDQQGGSRFALAFRRH